MINKQFNRNDKNLNTYFIKKLEKKFPEILNKMQSTLVPLKKLIFDEKRQELIFPEMYITNNINKTGIYIFLNENNVEFIGHSLINCNKRVTLHLNNTIQNGQIFFGNKLNCIDRSILLLTTKDTLDYNLLLSLESFLIKKIRPKHNILID